MVAVLALMQGSSKTYSRGTILDDLRTPFLKVSAYS
jgi:hypothetical protein